MATAFENQLLQKLQFSNFDLDSKIINDIIKDLETERNRLQGLWNRYRGEVPIKDRVLPDPYKTNSKLAHNFREQITSQYVGYFLGVPIVYSIDNSKYTEPQELEIKNEINNFNNLNSIADLDMLTGEYASVCGFGSRLLYIDQDGLIRAINVVPWECVWITNPTTQDTTHAMLYYTVDVTPYPGAKTEKKWRVEFYNDKTVRFYMQGDGTEFILENEMPHMFNGVPLIKFCNNNLEKGDFEGVETLIDTYDILISDAQNELIDFRMAYLLILGAQMDEQDVVRAKQTGTFTLPGDDVDMRWLTKDLPVTFYADQAKRYRDNIYNLSGAIDYTDQVWGGNAESGIARRMRLQNCESNTIKKERKFQRGLEKEYYLIAGVWNKKNIPLDPTTMMYVFVRSMPIDLAYYFQMASMAKGTISDETLLSLLPFIPDPSEELRRIKKQNVETGKLLDLELFDTKEEESGSIEEDAT